MAKQEFVAGVVVHLVNLAKAAGADFNRYRDSDRARRTFRPPPCTAQADSGKLLFHRFALTSRRPHGHLSNHPPLEKRL
jgi:hypothetical protein